MFTRGSGRNRREVQLIAEIKTGSPFGFVSSRPWDELFALANRHGDIVSVHTDPRWGGSVELVKKARQLTERPILAKGIHESDDLIRDAHAAGADFILVVGRVPLFQNGMLKKCLIEPVSLQNMKDILHACMLRGFEPRLVWNSRDLETGKLKTDLNENETWQEARKLYSGWMCQASNITSIKDVEKDADAVLVGENLEAFVESLTV
jgi:indole-3-glycerol phosphate synthase